VGLSKKTEHEANEDLIPFRYAKPQLENLMDFVLSFNQSVALIDWMCYAFIRDL